MLVLNPRQAQMHANKQIVNWLGSHLTIGTSWQPGQLNLVQSGLEQVDVCGVTASMFISDGSFQGNYTSRDQSNGQIRARHLIGPIPWRHHLRSTL